MNEIISGDSAIGKDINGTHLWMAEPFKDEHGETFWLATGRSDLFVRYQTLRQMLSHFIRYYPGTTAIYIIKDKKFHFIDLGEATHKVVIDGIMETLDAI